MRKHILFLVFLSIGLRAECNTQGFELVHTVPVETQLATPDLRDPVTVWCELFDGAKQTIDIAQFYVSGKPGEPLDAVIARLRAAGERGVKIRFLMDKHGLGMSEESTIKDLKAIPNLTFSLLDYGKVGGGIIHAKYFIVDGEKGYLGSQNFDWRSLEHIHETGVLVSDTNIAHQMQEIFNIDWHAQQLQEKGEQLPALNHHAVLADESHMSYLVASPNAFNPPGVGDSESELPRLMAKAEKEVWIQVMDYAPLSYAKGARPYYAVIDNAVRATAQRGVKVYLMVADWNTKEPELSYLKSLEILPNVTVKIISIPQSKKGFIPYARVIHTKAMDIDDKIAWVGTSNWEGGYMDNSRNLEMVVQDTETAKRVGDLARQLWTSPYAQELDINRSYPRPHPGSEK